MSFINESNFVAASLLVISEIFKVRSDVRLEIFRFSYKSTKQDLPSKVISSAAKKGAAGGDDDDDEDEEVFQDVDRVIDEQHRQDKKEVKETLAQSSKKKYDALKREPKYSNAKDSAIYELVCLSNHCHPTIRHMAEELSNGKSIKFSGDPLLDLGLSNFLDRIAYKNPKMDEKAQAFRKRMAQYEKPVTEINFAEGERPLVNRPEEEYLYKYMQQRPPKEKKAKDVDD